VTSATVVTAPPPLSPAEAMKCARAIVENSGSSFGFAMRIMPRQRREGMYAIYAFARAVDDIADGDAPADEKRRLLQDWRQEIARVYGGTPQTPVGMALAKPVERYSLPEEEFLLLIEGMEMDANGPIRAPSLDTLFRYTRRAAGTVGILSMRVFGVAASPAADHFALSLADALQLTNILRDVREDAEIGRLYLPREMLDAQAISTSDPMAALREPALKNVCADLGDVADIKFAEARSAMRGLDRAKLRPAVMMLGVYEAYLDRLKRRGWALEGPPVTMTKREKLTRALRYAFFPSLRS